jgi:hypothetical protein
MEPSCVHHIRDKDITVLIHFVRVSRLVTTGSCEGKLRDGVKPIAHLGRVDVDLNLIFLLFCSVLRIGRS